MNYLAECTLGLKSEVLPITVSSHRSGGLRLCMHAPGIGIKSANMLWD